MVVVAMVCCEVFFSPTSCCWPGVLLFGHVGTGPPVRNALNLMIFYFKQLFESIVFHFIKSLALCVLLASFTLC